MNDKKYFIGHGAEDKFFSAVMSLDKSRVEQLRASGVKLSVKAKTVLVYGSFFMDTRPSAKAFLEAYCGSLKEMSAEDLAWISRTFFEETKSKLYYPPELKKAFEKNLSDRAVFTALLDCYDIKKLNKKQTMMKIISESNIPLLEVCAAHGWLKQPKKRDEMIELANALKLTEVTAWLLDYKNRTADLSAERAKAEKKANRELNAAPDSVLELGKLWSWKKQEDGTLMITSYKGEQTEVTVPVKIGKNTVTAIGECALSPIAPRLRVLYCSRRGRITKITVPNGIKTIGEYAFFGPLSRRWHSLTNSRLKEIIFPETLEYFKDRESALNAPEIIEYNKSPVAVIPHLENARIFCIRSDLRYRYYDEDTVHIPYKEVTASDPLFSAILEGDAEKVRALKKSGAVLTDYIKDCLLNPKQEGDVLHDVHATQINPLFNKEEEIPNREFILKTLVEELGEPLYYYLIGFVRDQKPELLDIQLKYGKSNFLNRITIMYRFILDNKPELLAVCAKHGWLKLPETRDKMIQYATDVKKTEVLAWLLDYKNRTADLDAERRRAEKRRERELNADPNSPTALKRIWGWKKQEDGTLVITSYKGKHTDITVPSTIGKDPVTAIGEKAFSPNAAGITREQVEFRKTIRRVTLPDSIKRIGVGAFRFCETLSEFVIPDSVSEIDDDAFIYCAGLTEIVVPETVKKLGNSMFAGCTKLRFVKLPENMPAIGDNMFSNCKALRNITLPKGIRSIGKRAFSSCAELLALDIPDSVSEIGSQAFCYCTKLTEIVVPNTVTELGNGAFEWCTALHSIKLSENISEIGNYTFTRCEALKSIKLPNAVRSVKMGAFASCGALEEIVVPDGTTEIGQEAFADCGALKTVVIPASVKKMSNDVFDGSDNVTVTAAPNSFAEGYCREHNIRYKE